jgi:hypothetical protein
LSFRKTFEEYIRLENDGRDRERRFQERPGDFLIDLRVMLDILNSSLRNEVELESSVLGQKLKTSISILRAGIGDLISQEKLG